MNGYYRLIASMIRGGGSNPLWNGLQAYYTADNTPNDALGNYNGTLTNGATYGTGIINQGFSFDGINDYVDLGNNLDFDGSTPFSFNVWVKKNSKKFNGLISKAGGAPSYVGYNFRFDQSGSGGYLNFILTSDFTTTNQLYCRSNSAVPLSSMNMCTVSYDGSKSVSGVKFYINGVVDSTVSVTDNLTGSVTNSNNCTLGAVPLGGNVYLNGIIDEVGVWSRELTSAEVTELYNGGAGLQYS